MSQNIPQVDSNAFQAFLELNATAVVDFYADWCGPCKIVSSIIEKLALEYEGRVKFAKLDVDASPDIAEKFDVMSIPTVFIFKNGNAVDRIVGAAPTDTYQDKIERVI